MYSKTCLSLQLGGQVLLSTQYEHSINIGQIVWALLKFKGIIFKIRISKDTFAFSFECCKLIYNQNDLNLCEILIRNVGK